jgi:glycosyltransferase involved in cell wall biosynthesis
MHVLNVNSYLDFKTGGGTAERTFQMSRYLAGAGAKCTVLTIDTGLDDARIASMKPASVVAFPLLLRRFFVPRVRWSVLRKVVAEADFIHIMGHWTLLNALVYCAARLARKPYVVCPAGALPIYGRSKLLKWIYNLLIGKAIIRNASGWIAVTAAEYPHFEAYGIAPGKVTVIPNGVAEEDFKPVMSENEFRQRFGLTSARIVLFMGRLNLIKGPDLLLEAFARLKELTLGYQLVFVGPDEGMKAALVRSAAGHGISDQVRFLGFLESSDKTSAYRAAQLLVVPSRHEAMSIVALEAGMCGTAAMLTDQCGFGEVREADPRLEVEATVEGIAAGLKCLLTNPTVIDGISVAFEKLVRQRYSWHTIVTHYLRLYEQLAVQRASGVK